MRHSVVSVLVTGLALVLCPDRSEAQIARVFVSVMGNDANGCSVITTPCRTLNGAINQVDSQGEVIVIDSGSYAGANITKPVKVNVAPGVVAFSATQIKVNPGAGATVVLRGLTLKAITPGTGNGVEHLSGNLFIENTVVDGWANGVTTNAGTKVYLKDTIVRNNSVVGINSDVGLISMDNVRVENNNFGFSAFGTTQMTATRSVFSGNVVGVNVSGAGASVNLQGCQIAGNQIGVTASASGTARLSDCAISANGTGLENTSGTIETYGNNQLRGNSTPSTGSITAVLLQ